MVSILPYLQKIKQHLSNDNARQLAQLLSVSGPHTRSLVEQNMDISRLEGQCKNRIESPWDDMVTCHLKTICFLDKGLYDEAFASQKELVQIFQRAMPSMTRWCIPILVVINNDLRHVATLADIAAATEKKEDNPNRKKLEDAANVISKSFTHCVTDRNPMNQSKKYGTYAMIGILFRIYFKLKQQNLCKNLLRAVRATDMPSLDEFPKSDRVTFRYYLGRLNFLAEDYGKAEHELDLAFRECALDRPKNRELILQILLPIRLMRGVLPSAELFEQFSSIRRIYGSLVRAIRRGNITAFNNSLASHEHTLIRQGTYFAVEKAQSIVMRQLFRRVFLTLDSNTRIPISTFNTALKIMQHDVDMEETEWILANLIYKGYIRGYLSHEKLFAVLSKGDPFPKVSTVALPQ